MSRLELVPMATEGSLPVRDLELARLRIGTLTAEDSLSVKSPKSTRLCLNAATKDASLSLTEFELARPRVRTITVIGLSLVRVWYTRLRLSLTTGSKDGSLPTRDIALDVCWLAPSGTALNISSAQIVFARRCCWCLFILPAL